MPTTSPSAITQLLAAVGQGDGDARDRLWEAVYQELHAVAQRQLAAESPGRTLQPTALINEAYLRLFGGGVVRFDNRRHFFAAAAESMRRIRTDDARTRNRLKRGGGHRPESLEEPPPAFDQDPAEVLAVNEALDTLKREDPRKAEVVLLRYFVGLSIDETADALGLSPRTIDSEWRFARAGLHRALSDE